MLCAFSYLQFQLALPCLARKCVSLSCLPHSAKRQETYQSASPLTSTSFGRFFPPQTMTRSSHCCSGGNEMSNGGDCFARSARRMSTHRESCHSHGGAE